MRDRAVKTLSLFSIFLLVLSSMIVISTETAAAEEDDFGVYYYLADTGEEVALYSDSDRQNRIYHSSEAGKIEYEWYDAFELVLFNQNTAYDALLDWIAENSPEEPRNTGLVPYPSEDKGDATSVYEERSEPDTLDFLLNIPTAVKNQLLKIPEAIVGAFSGAFEFIEGIIYDAEAWVLRAFGDSKYGEAVALPIAMAAVLAGLFLLIYAIIWIIGAIPVL